MRLVAAYSCSKPMGGLASPAKLGRLLLWVAPTARHVNSALAPNPTQFAIVDALRHVGSNWVGSDSPPPLTVA